MNLQRSLYTMLLRRVLLPIGDMAFRQGLMRRLQFLEAAQWWDKSRLEEYRNKHLRRLVDVAYRDVPLYRELMDQVGVRPGDVRRVEDLSKLPVISKSMLRAGYPDRTTRSTGYATREAKTSGSTGKNFYVLEDSETTGRNRAAFILGVEWAGWNIGERHLHTGWNLERTADRRLKDAFLRCHYVSAYDLTDESLDRNLAALEAKQIDYLWGSPASIYYLARRAVRVGWNRRLKAISTWGDNLYPHYRTAIEAAFRARVYDLYGCSEGFHIAAQCGQSHGYHVHMLDVVIEYVRDDGEPAHAGEPAHLLVTRLHPGAMPFLRYRVGDMATRGVADGCPCGRELERMESIEGRDSDVVVTPSGNRLIVHYFTGILKHFPEIDEFQVVQRDVGEIVLRVVPVDPGRFSAELIESVIAQLRQKGADDLRINIEQVSEIPLGPRGKRRFVINELDL